MTKKQKRILKRRIKNYFAETILNKIAATLLCVASFVYLIVFKELAGFIFINALFVLPLFFARENQILE